MADLLINIRSKSKGEVVTFGIKCPECDESNKVQLDLETVEIIGSPKSTKEMVIGFTKDVGVVMRYPTIEVFKTEKDLQKFEGQFDFFVGCIDSVYDGEIVHSAKDQTKQEMTDFVDNLSDIHFNQIAEFINDIPTLKVKIDFDCIKCKKAQKTEVSDFMSFLA